MDTQKSNYVTNSELSQDIIRVLTRRAIELSKNEQWATLRLAELLKQGEKATLVVRWYERTERTRTYTHYTLCIRRENGKFEKEQSL